LMGTIVRGSGLRVMGLRRHRAVAGPPNRARRRGEPARQRQHLTHEEGRGAGGDTATGAGFTSDRAEPGAGCALRPGRGSVGGARRGRIRPGRGGDRQVSAGPGGSRGRRGARPDGRTGSSRIGADTGRLSPVDRGALLGRSGPRRARRARARTAPGRPGPTDPRLAGSRPGAGGLGRHLERGDPPLPSGPRR
jgi:translation initiation factor IF-2